MTGKRKQRKRKSWEERRESKSKSKSRGEARFVFFERRCNQCPSLSRVSVRCRQTSWQTWNVRGSKRKNDGPKQGARGVDRSIDTKEKRRKKNDVPGDLLPPSFDLEVEAALIVVIGREANWAVVATVGRASY